MASQSLYRKWRSQTFSDLVGQEGVVHTLLNAVRDQRLAHAYLFCGPRGTGKTSVARLLAKAVNCQNPQNGEPCNVCISCQEITSGRSPDVIEIDAASNTGVDNIRDLRENVNLLGSGGHHKVYVVDECHMLSTAAFNALLKTLEEPPPHVIFVLATTEAHKVLPTIVSRCQRFDFRRFGMREITGHLRHIAEGEGLTLEPAAVEMIARAAQGGMRDALSLLDQAITFCGNQIDAESVRRMLGLADPAALRTLIEAVAEGDTAAGLERIHALVTTGADLRQLTAQYGEEWRALMLARAGADLTTIMDRTAEETQTTAALAQRFSLEQLAACARVFARNEQPARGLPVPQLALELAFLECVSICSGNNIFAAESIAPTTMPKAVRHKASAEPAQQTAQTPASPPLHLEPVPESVPESVPEPQPEMPLAVLEERAAEALAATPSMANTEIAGVGARYETPRPPTQPAQPAQPPLPAQQTAQQTTQDPALQEVLRDIQRRWTMIKKVCKQKSSMVSGLLNNAQPIRLDTGTPPVPVLVIAVEFPFHLEKLREPSKREAVEWALEQVLERPMRVRMVLASEGGSGAQPATRLPDGPQQMPSTPAQTKRRHSPEAPNDTLPNNIVPFPTVQAAGAATPPPPMSHTQDMPLPAAASMPAPTSPSQSPSQVSDLAALEREVRDDPVIKELMRQAGTELAEVRPLDDDERS